ncbi:hypothetical protein [Glycomyces salinus]|uniref:hypothetical protein n=1 Tax=Glycomyces salinus TaxID=980294 RepID=UPI0018EC753A|nr:hypothetical protein [Glycomyces salinus]
MRILRALAATLPLVVIGLAAPASAQEPENGSFSVLSYNIAGLPAFLQDGDPETNTPIIGSRLDPYDIVHAQEDFNYHASLYAADDHPHRTATSGGVPFGSGLNTLSNYPWTEFDRITWDDCHINQADCLTPKGFTFMRLELADGATVDLYNLHADAGNDQGDLDARASNFAQVTEYIESHSAGNAVIVYGDTNTRYTRAGDPIAGFASDNGLTDAWVELARGGDEPQPGDPALVCDDANVTTGCEVVDKVLYRGGDGLDLEAVEYRNDHADFRDDEGENLSDHYPIAVEFDWTLG